jgi:hypothetical protein
MATISVAVAVRDEIEANRKKQGDIMGFMPGGHQWGGIEVKNHLIIEVALPPQATMDKCMALLSKYYSTGVLAWDDVAELLGKRRFKIDWNKLKTIVSQAGIVVDWAKVEDPGVAYQPLSAQDAAPGGKTASLDPTKMLFDKYENRLIKSVDFNNWIIA